MDIPVRGKEAMENADMNVRSPLRSNADKNVRSPLYPKTQHLQYLLDPTVLAVDVNVVLILLL